MVRTELKNGICVVSVDNPPVNTLGHRVRLELLQALGRSLGDDAVKGVVIICLGRTFFAGADISEFGKPMTAPLLNDVIDAIEASPKPVVAAIHGTALGGGLEVALGCHYRIAVPSAKLGLPEVKLGMLPGAGGTQRLPRVVGLEAAMPMITTGEPISAQQALSIGLIDRLADEGDLEASAIIFAQDVRSAIIRRTRDMGVNGSLTMVDAYETANSQRFAGQDAPTEILTVLRAAVELPFDEGRLIEQQAKERLLSGSQSRALRYYFFAERAAAKVDDLPEATRPITIRKVGILGAGTMGGGIAMNFLSAGIPVVLVEREQAPLDRGAAAIRNNYDRAAQRGRITSAQVEQAMTCLTPTLSFDQLADCDLVIEAVFELMDIKKQVFAQLDRVMKEGAILATNTSYLDVDVIAASTQRPDSVIGLHFFSPANVMKLLEVVRGEHTSPAVLLTAIKLAKTVGKIPVVSRVCHGFIGNRMLKARQAQSTAISEEGARPADIDRVLLEFGFPMGPFQMSDLAGLDIGWDPRDTASRTVRERLCEAGLRGQKNGHGFYDYDSQRNRVPSSKAEEIIRAFAKEHAIEQREIDDREILERLLFPMVNEGALILEEGIAQRASDIDVVWVNGYGWPRQTGGPMFWAGTIGLQTVVAGLERHRRRLGAAFRMSTLLIDKAAAGECFDERDS